MKKTIPEKTKARGEAFRKRMLVDLAVKGFGDEDIQDVELDKDVDTSDPRVILRWEYTVHLSSGHVLSYTLANVDNAPIFCDGKELVEVGEA